MLARELSMRAAGRRAEQVPLNRAMCAATAVLKESQAPAMPQAQEGGGSGVGQHSALFEQQAEVYKTYRRPYPRHIYDAIYAFAGLQRKGLAVDTGCGTGQVAVGLAEDFEQVIGLDSSAGQIQHAAARPNVEYRVAPAEANGLPAACADLVVAAQCMHWFDVPAFYREVRRTLNPSGALAVFGYMPSHIYFPGSAEAGAALQRLASRTHGYFHERRQNYVLQHYEGQEPTPSDFGVVESRVMEMERQLSVEQILGWIRSMSGWTKYVEEHGEAEGAALLQGLRGELLAALGLVDDSTPVVSIWPLTCIFARQPVPLD